MQKKENYIEQRLAVTLVDLLAGKELNDISVRELCDKAGVGRASFYRHFASKEEVLERHAKYLLEKWAEEFESDPASKPDNVFASLFFQLKDQQSFFELLHKTGRDGILRAAIRSKIKLINDLPNEAAYQKAFIADGISGWVEEWIARGMQESPDELNRQLGYYFTQVMPTLSKLYKE